MYLAHLMLQCIEKQDIISTLSDQNVKIGHFLAICISQI